ncbi:MAG: prepilin-type N-terminal cleavage/methylation domain-containing protein [Minisyncoccia bacterium]|jgi:prepilin-type N-terminal cleavage/methylation domain-containing protein
MGNGTDHNKKGFTLIEILIVLAITALLSSLAIVYTHVGQNQISLSIEESKVAQLILEAKELSVATYSSNSPTCAYGVAFNYASSTYSLFAYNAAVTSPLYPGRQICPSLASTSVAFNASDTQPYQPGSWQVHTAQGVVLDGSGGAASDTIQYILFYPPNPCTMINLAQQTTFRSNCSSIAGSPPSASYVYLSTVDKSMSRTITVNPAGQVSL